MLTKSEKRLIFERMHHKLKHYVQYYKTCRKQQDLQYVPQTFGEGNFWELNDKLDNPACDFNMSFSFGTSD